MHTVFNKFIEPSTKPSINSYSLQYPLPSLLHASPGAPSPIGPALKCGAWKRKKKKREEFNSEAEQIFRTRA